MNTTVNKVIVLGGGSAGFMAALAIKAKLPKLDVLVIRSKDIGIIGVGEGSTVALTRFLHEYLKVGQKKFHEIAQPVWKLGLHFIWGPRPWFHYTFAPGPEARYEDLPKAKGYYCDETVEYMDLQTAMMQYNRVFERGPAGPKLTDFFSYHFENEKYVQFLEGYAIAPGVRTLDDTVLEVKQDEKGVAGLVLKGGATETADLYVDASGFVSLLLGNTLAEPFVSFKTSLFCDRAVVGGWNRTGEMIQPYTTCETMNSGWCWQIEHENRINRGYVYASDFISDNQAEREFREKNPKITQTHIVRFVTGRYERNWVKNVVAIGNSSGFVEPLEATALGVIAMQSRLLADTLYDSDRQLRPTQVREYNVFHQSNWDAIRGFIAVHYKYNTRLDTEFWRAAREKTDIAGAAPIIEYYAENGPSNLWQPTMFSDFDQFKFTGYAAMLVGMRVPYRKTHVPSDTELQLWNAKRQRFKDLGQKAYTVREMLDLVPLAAVEVAMRRRH